MSFTDTVVVVTSVVAVLLSASITVYCLTDLVRTPDAEVQVFSKPVWAAVLVLGSIVGAMVWVVYGRPRRGG